MKNGSLEDGETDIYTFVCKLRQEKLFIKSEKIHIQELNELIKKKTQAVIKSSWLTNKQRLLLLERRVSSQNCQHFDFVHNSEFVEAKNTSLGFQNAVKISNLLHILRSQPKQLANWLITGETITEDNIEYPLILQSLLNGLYGGCLFAEDTKLVLTLLFELAKKQLIKSDNPRRIIKHRSCSFKHLYFLFHEIYQPAKFFLSAALEMPILEVLSFSDYFLDIDHDKTIMRFRQEDSLKMYKDAVEYRNDVASKLAQFINSFIQSLLENVCSFPKAMAWISCHIYKMIEKSFCAKEANAIITELLFTFFICPVILDPEQYGISNSSTSEMARHNLIEIGKILQLLALYKFEGIDKKYMDIFENVDKNSMSNFVELLFFDMDSNEPPVETTPEIVRDIMLFTDEELNNLICFLQKVQMMRIANDNIEKNPSLSVSIEEHLSSLTVPSRDNSPKTSRPNGEVSDYNSTNNVGKKTAFFSLGSLGTHKNNHHSNNSRRSTEEEPKNHAKNTVIVFPIDGVITEPVGLLPEDKVIDLSVPVKNDSGVFEASSDIVTCKDNMMETSVVSTRGDIKGGYSGYADEGSIGNTSDNLEAISEAASNHSVASSLELENEDQNDNLSDMVSANVSGRGTPNISGRDTPSSQVNENEDRAHVDPAQPPGDHVDAGVRQQQLPQSPPTVNISERQRRSEIDDKFCKFEIQRLLEGDETVSIISETWSTDVLSSDTETVEGDPRNDRHQHLPHLVDQAIQEVPMENVLDISETQSEGAWSTDVMASDTERLTEVDNDDAASVAQSDDTNSVARSDDTRSETDEAASARRLSSCSSSYGGISGGGAVANTTYAPPSGNSPSYVSTSNSMFLSHTTSTSSSYKSTTDANFVTINQTYVTGTSYQEFKKRDSRINGKINSEIDSNANNVFKPLSPTTQTNQEQFDCVTDPATPSLKPEKTDDMNFLAGPSGLNGKPLLDFDSEQSFIKPTTAMKNYGDRPTEILLSNCSLNSSSSGSSSNSFENKAPTTENPDQWEPKPWLNSSGSSLNVTLTPSESTSELSVMSVNSHLTSNVINPTGAIKKTLKPSASTGAIPKSISFDMSVDKGLDDDSRSKRGGFFGRLRKGFGYKKRPFRNQEEMRNGDGYDYLVKRGVVDSPVRNNNTLDTSEDILAKYRKPLSENSPIKENGTVKKLAKTSNDDNLNSDTNSFADIKKKLRLVLGNTSEIPYYIKHNPCTIKLKLETILRLELGKARKLRDGSAAARVAEALRCVKQLEERRCVKLIESLRADLMVRAAYLRYLVDSKQELLFAQMYLSSLHDQIKQDRLQCEVYFASVCVREFLNEQEQLVLSFCDEFRRLNLADEKCDFLQNFLKKLFEVMHENKHWKDVLHKRDFLIKFTLERCIVSRVYFNAIYPNGDGDRDRDRVLHDHISTLSKTLHPDHKDLLIPSVYLREMPWLPAQEALRALDAARAPRDKIRCVSRCAKCLVDLLGLSGSCAAADDFTPVLVFVIIKVNPVALLSTIQFVNSFHAGQIKGEDEYWWTQFCSAVEYIKTMDYSD